jgi:cystathionine gamma-synthase
MMTGETLSLDRQLLAEGVIGAELLMNPVHRPDQLDWPIPDDPHACSVGLTTIDSTLRFCEGEEGVLSRGYPRFVVTKEVLGLSKVSTETAARLPFPSRATAADAAYLARTYADNEGAEIRESNGLFWLDNTAENRMAWQNTGLGISSRQAQAISEGRDENDEEKRSSAVAAIKGKISKHTECDVSDIYLFPTGMAAIYTIDKVLKHLGKGKPSVQFGFSYTDTHTVQRNYGPHENPASNNVDLRSGSYRELEDYVGDRMLRGLFTEVPSNPKLWTPDLGRLDKIVGDKAPIVIDDTIATMFNIDPSALPDSVVARVTSLTKFFSCVGNVMGGSVVLRKASPHYEAVKDTLEGMYESNIWHEDAAVLAENSKLFERVMPVINANADMVAKWLTEYLVGPTKPLKDVFYPSVSQEKPLYDKLKRRGAGYSGLMSMVFNNPEKAYASFDRVRVSKGPSLGTLFSLGCPYTHLAHHPVESVSKFGVPPDLLRFSIGVENPQNLLTRLSEMFEA